MEILKISGDKRLPRKRISLNLANSDSLHSKIKHDGAQHYHNKVKSPRPQASAMVRTQCTKSNPLKCLDLPDSDLPKEVKQEQFKTLEGEQSFENQERRVGLKEDVTRLKKKLTCEINLHKALERAFHRPTGTLPRVPRCLPSETQELIAEVAVLEEEIVSLENQFFTLQQDLYNETVYKSAFQKQQKNPTVSKNPPLPESATYGSSKGKPCSSDCVTRLFSFEKELLGTSSRKPKLTLKNRSPLSNIREERACNHNNVNSATGANKCTNSCLDKPETPKTTSLDSVVLSPGCKNATMQPTNGDKGNHELQATFTLEKSCYHPLRLEVGGKAEARNTAVSLQPAPTEKEDLSRSRRVSNFSATEKGEKAELCESLNVCTISSSHLKSDNGLHKFKELPSDPSERKGLNSTISQFCQRTDPNRLSEDTMRCLLTIYLTMTRPCPMSDSDSLSNLSLSTFSSFSSQTSGSKSSDNTKFNIGISDQANTPDPYGVCETLHHDIGPYRQFHDVTAASFDYGHIPDCTTNLKRLREMVGKLAKLDLHGMSRHQKLAFWINIYNTCMMHAFLEYGMPCSSRQVITLTRKAILTVGGRLLNPQSIEHMLRLPTRSNKPFTASKQITCMQSTLGLEWPEPQVVFALCCGARSSPAVRVYTAVDVDDELELAKKEYLQAAIGFTSKHKVLIPQLLEWSLGMFAKDAESLLDWLGQQLPKSLQLNVKECLEKANGAVSRVLEVMPYDYNFRYLLP
ncbi:hypothetical protein O6H91_21G075300 [Diphasiastrum complanatum]|uniref:Uncharacterized protein n=1 Tax=Diphasiastrum complanatum TaxID=34168 RepID=A0ACC2AN74_DIPCM|nr:hypothetical protein O6H91_21G075300 [Diphasiastrum complanatum]